jgi:hypothetical protein
MAFTGAESSVVLITIDSVTGQVVISVNSDVITLNSSGTETIQSVSIQNITTTYLYDANGVLLGVSGSGTSLSNDGFGNYTAGTITQVFSDPAQSFGQAKLVSSRTLTWSSNAAGGGSYANPIPGPDKTWNKQDMTVTYTFDSRWRATGGTGIGTGVSDDGNGNRTVSHITQNYTAINGQSKLKSVTTTSEVYHWDDLTSQLISGMWDGTTNLNSMTVSYVYDSNGKMTAADGQGESSSTYAQGSSTSKIHQIFSIANGQARLDTIETTGTSTGNDGSKTTSLQIQRNYYDSRNRMVGSIGTNHSVTENYEDVNNVQKITSRSETNGYTLYKMIRGQAKQSEVYSDVQYDALNGPPGDVHSGSRQNMKVTYTYDSAGVKFISDISGAGS